MDAAGDAALIFGFNGIRVDLRPALGGFANPEWGGVRVSAEGVEGSSPDVAIDAAGDTVAVWQQLAAPRPQIYAASRPAGGQFGAPVPVSPEGQESSAPSVALDSHGDATVAWLHNDATNQVVQVATASLGGAFSSPVGVSGDGHDASNVRVTTDPQDDAVVSWTRASGGGNDLEVAIRQAGGSFGAPNAQGDGEIVGGAQAGAAQRVVMDAAGDALAVWKGPAGEVLDARLAAGGSSFGAPATLAMTVGTPSAAMDESGEAVVVWPSGRSVQVATAPPGGAFGLPVELASSLTPNAPQVTIGASGSTAVMWEGPQGGGTAREGASRPPDGAFAKPSGIFTSQTAVEGSLIVASDSAGDTVGVWNSNPFGDMQSALYDNGPSLNGLSVPSGGQAGRALSFSIAQPVSVWRPLNAVTWSFGDGGTAAGLSATHIYAQPGTYQVTVTATDTQYKLPPFPFPEYVGNSASQNVVIGPAAAAQESQQQSVSPTIATESLGGLSIRPSAFVASAAGPSATVAASRKTATTSVTHAGATVRFTLTLPGSARFTVERLIVGVRTGRSCVATTATLSHAHACTLRRTLAHFTRSGSAGVNGFHFTGRIDGRKLTPGKYVLTAASGQSTHSQAVIFHVLRG
jgi:hypothetical protein